MINNTIALGNKSASHILNHYLQTSLPSKTFLFYGMPGIGKKTTAKIFAQEILKKVSSHQSGRKLDSGNHPDLHEYYPDSKSGLYTIQSMRDLIHEIPFPPFESKRKIFIIYELDKTLEVSLQSLLKTLEEPIEDTIIILVSDAVENVLPTITSRCIKVHFSPIADYILAEILHIQKKVEINKAQKIAKLSGGSIQKAMLFLTYNGPYLHEQLYNLLDNFKKKSIYEIQEAINSLHELCFEKQLYQIQDMFELVYLFFRDIFIQSIGLNDLQFPWEERKTGDFFSIDLVSIENLIIQAKKQLRIFIKPKNVLLNFFLSIQELIHSAQITK